MVLRQVMVPYIESYDFGVGADAASGSPMGKAVDGTPTPVLGAGGTTVSFDVSRIQTTEDLETALGINAEVSFGCGAFGAGVSARFGFAKKAKVQSSALFMAVTAQIKLAHLSIDDPVLSADAAALVDNPTAFAGRYGNMFVRGIARGGMFVGCLRIDTQSSEESQEISASLSGSYGLFSAEAEMKFSDVQRKYRTESYLNIYQEGGPAHLSIADPTDPMILLENANRFLESFANNPSEVAVPYFAVLAPMEIARGPLPPNGVDLEHAQDVLVSCSKARSRTLDKINLLEYIVDNRARYTFPPGADAALVRAIQDYQADFDLIARCASSAMRSPSRAKMPSPYAQAAGETYPRGILPENLPTPNAARTVPVPDFSGCQSWAQCVETAARVGLAAEQNLVGEQVDNFKFMSQIPPKDTAVPEGSKVTITYQPVKPSSLLYGLEVARERGHLYREATRGNWNR